MSLAGLKKQFNKANQYMNERIGGAEATKLSDEFLEMERRVVLTNDLVDDLLQKTKEFLQPNPASRAKLMAASKISKMSGGPNKAAYPQPEGTLGEAMVKFGKQLGEDGSSEFARSLIEMGEAMKQMADVKYALEDNVKQNFLEPLQQLQAKDLKDVMYHRKKMQSRRLDYDCKKRRQVKGPGGVQPDAEEVRVAEEKFDESLQQAQTGMHNLLENDIEQLSQLAALSEALYEYHKQCTDVLQGLTETLVDYKNEAASRPRTEFVPKPLHELAIPSHYEDGDLNAIRSPGRSPYHSRNASPAHSRNASPDHSPTNSHPPPNNLFPNTPGFNNQHAASPGTPVNRPPPAHQMPSCTALFDFDAENENELAFREGDVITLIQKIDDNWYEGAVRGKKGYFPVSYVEVKVPLP